MPAKPRRSLMRMLCLAEGACCPYAYLIATGDLSSKQIADRLGVAPRTVRYWREQVRKGRCTCEGNGKCYLGNAGAKSS